MINDVCNVGIQGHSYVRKGGRYMAVKLRIPTPLRRLTGGQAELTIQARTIDELLMQLQYDYESLARQILDDQGEIRSFVRLFVNDEDIESLQGRATPLKDGDVVSIIPSIAGGRPLQ